MTILDEKQAFIGTRRSRVLGYQTCRVWIVAIREGLDENAMADKIGHDWRNPESYGVDHGVAIDW